MTGRLAEIADSFFTPAVNDLVPYEPGKPVEEVQRELGLGRVVKLASNEGPYGPSFDASLTTRSIPSSRCTSSTGLPGSYGTMSRSAGEKRGSSVPATA